MHAEDPGPLLLFERSTNLSIFKCGKYRTSSCHKILVRPKKGGTYLVPGAVAGGWRRVARHEWGISDIENSFCTGTPFRWGDAVTARSYMTCLSDDYFCATQQEMERGRKNRFSLTRTSRGRRVLNSCSLKNLVGTHVALCTLFLRMLYYDFV